MSLALLGVGLVVERGLGVGQVLAVTFTEAATQELRKRIRERLLLAERLVDAAPATAASPEAVLTRAVLDAHPASGIESREALRRLMHAAANDHDLAAIFPSHGLCHRLPRVPVLQVCPCFPRPCTLPSHHSLQPPTTPP